MADWKVLRQIQQHPIRTGCLSLMSLLAVANLLAYWVAYTFTHTVYPNTIGLGQPRRVNQTTPQDLGLRYSTHRISVQGQLITNPEAGAEWIDLWSIPVTDRPIAKGQVLMFHGKGGHKGQLLQPALAFHQQGYEVILIDFRGAGRSSGHTTTIGVREAQDVVATVNYARQMRDRRSLILYGLSMGSAAILKAVAEGKIQPDGIILELPFARLLDATRGRIRDMKLPVSPVSETVLFWGGVQNGFNGFLHNPEDYAKRVRCPALLLHGQRDRWTTTAAVQRILQNLQGSKQLVIFPQAGHELLMGVDRATWLGAIDQFLSKI
ncbi:MAG: alpha/beta fold hydrolase [Oscillatoriales cyanobacterium]|nr:MAG: alpha/beta fold hydrolase [Oscillatoriales cyanobacterium]